MGTTPGMNVASDMSEQMMMEMGQPDPEAITQKILADQGRYGDQVMGHLAPGEIVVPKKLASDPELLEKLQEVYGKFGVDMNQYTVGNEANSINPNTGIMEFGFLSDLWGDIKKNAPTIGHIVGFAVGGPIGAGIGGAIGGAVKEGDLGYALKQGATGYTLGSMAAGAGLTHGTLSNPSLGFGSGGVTSGGVGGFFENLGANARGGLTGTMPAGATGIGKSFKALSGMEKGLAGLTGITALGGFESPEQQEAERPTVTQNPQISQYMNQSLGQAQPLEFTSGPQLANQSRNQVAGLVPVQQGIENSALLNYLESMRAQPVAQVVYPNFEAI